MPDTHVGQTMTPTLSWASIGFVQALDYDLLAGGGVLCRLVELADGYQASRPHAAAARDSISLVVHADSGLRLL